MFPRPETRIRTVFRRSLDAAIEFATLGEYGYAPAWEGPGRLAPLDNSVAQDWGFDAVDPAAAPQRGAKAALLEPSSAAGRARRNAERRAAPACAGQPLRGHALTPQLPRTSRQRDGMAPREQYCVADDA
jgi:hypothetical protein